MLNNPKSTEEYLCNNVEIELNSKLPRDQCSHASENNLICGVCDALPPAGSLPSSCQHVGISSRKSF